jgi:NADH:ubiquinone oxidoreductase subunit F (NADH-binding)
MPSLITGVHPSVTPRLMLPEPGHQGREDRAAYEARGGYSGGPGGYLEGADLISAVAESGLRGRGGAAFPLGVKLAAVAGQPGDHVLVVNGEEGEPASVKDRWLLRTRPHLVLDGALRAASAIGAVTAYVYVSDGQAAESIRTALAELDELPVPVHVRTVPHSYVAGEETAAVRAINGGPAKPADKPPRPFEEGVAGCPTLVSNVETIANLPRIAAAAGPGDDVSPGRGFGPAGHGQETFLVTLTGSCPRPGLYEVPFGGTLGETAETLGGLTGPPRGYLMGGYFAGLLNRRGHGLALDYDVFRDEGSGLGCGAVIVLGPADCPVGAAAQVMAYFDRNNASQCGSCFNGTAAMSGVTTALARGVAGPADVQRLESWAAFLPGRGACATLDGAASVARSLLREFPAEVEAHVRDRCGPCAELDVTAAPPPFAVAAYAETVEETAS